MTFKVAAQIHALNGLTGHPGALAQRHAVVEKNLELGCVVSIFSVMVNQMSYAIAIHTAVPVSGYGQTGLHALHLVVEEHK